MRIAHLALGGCIKAPPVAYGLTEDTGGHVAYVLGAAQAQAALPGVEAVEIVTRAFDDPRLGPVYAAETEAVAPRLTIRRLRTASTAYLAKDALEAELPALRDAFLALCADPARRPDIVHAHFADAAEIALAARARYGCRVVYTPHSLGREKAGCLRGAADGPLARRIAREGRAVAEADAILCSSRDEAERQLAAYDPAAQGRTHCIGPGASLPAAPEGTAEARALLAPFLRRPDLPLVLAIARPVAKKNLALLLEAFARRGLRERANLCIVAGLRDGPDSGDAGQRAVIRGLLDGIDRHDLWGHAALPRRHAPHHVTQLYRIAARGGVFVNPALHEPFGLTLLEAAAMGVPVVATRSGGPVDILGDLRNGLLVDPTDADGLARAIGELLSQPGARARMAAAGRRGLGRYGWAGWARQALRAYRAASTPAAPVPAAARMLVCDIDGTMTGDRDAAARLARCLEARRMPFAVATGRSVTQARRVLADWALPEPDAFVTSVGSEIWWPRGCGRLERDAAFAPDWDRAAVLARLRAGGATFQAEVEQRDAKLGCLGDAAEAARLRALLGHLGARVIHSHGELIDVLPREAGKAHAVAHVARRWGLTLADCVAAGDSGNDLDMLQACGAAIVVGNARLAELRSLTPRPGLIRATAPSAGGVLEGLGRLGALGGGPPLRQARAAAAPETRP
jgi:sucrose-phosphate synthase